MCRLALPCQLGLRSQSRKSRVWELSPSSGWRVGVGPWESWKIFLWNPLLWVTLNLIYRSTLFWNQRWWCPKVRAGAQEPAGHSCKMWWGKGRRLLKDNVNAQSQGFRSSGSGNWKNLCESLHKNCWRTPRDKVRGSVCLCHTAREGVFFWEMRYHEFTPPRRFPTGKSHSPGTLPAPLYRAHIPPPTPLWPVYHIQVVNNVFMPLLLRISAVAKNHCEL